MSGETGRAAAVLRAGGLVAFPTETVYGLGADATNPKAVRRLYAVKRRPADHPVIVHLSAADELDRHATEVSEAARVLAAALWPGPLTLVLATRPGSIAPEVTGGRPTVGLRVPDQPLALALLAEVARPVAAPSANRFGRVSPTTAADVLADLGSDVDLVLDGGPCRVGVESTIVDCSGADPVVLRPGGVSLERLAEVLERPVAIGGRTGGAPGTLATHYRPRATVEVCDAEHVVTRAAALVAEGRRVGVLAAGVERVPDGVVVLPAPDDVEELARVLYARLRAADDAGLDVLLAVPPSPGGLGTAVIDRLRRAAAAPPLV